MTLPPELEALCTEWLQGRLNIKQLILKAYQLGQAKVLLPEGEAVRRS